MDEWVESDQVTQQVSKTFRRPQFRRMSATTVRALNIIHKPRQALEFAYQAHRIKLAPINLGPPLYDPYRVRLNSSGFLGPIDLDRYLVKRLVAMLDADLAESHLDHAALGLALRHVLAEPLDQFERLAGQCVDPHFQAIEAADHQDKAAFDFGVWFEDDQDAAPARARLWVPQDRLDTFAATIDAVFPAGASNLPVFLPMHLTAGSCRLSVAEIRRLSVGDVLLIEDLAGPWPSAWLVVAGKRRVALTMERRQARIAGTLERYMSEQPDLKIDDGEIDDLEVDIKFELGRAQMPLRQLQMLAEGSVLPLERDYSSPVDIIVGGRRVGEGEIVDIDGRIGVRLVRFQGK